MSYLSPLGPVYQAGTLSGNPLAMAAGFAMFYEIDNDTNLYNRLEEKTKYLDIGITEVLKKKRCRILNQSCRVNVFSSF